MPYTAMPCMLSDAWDVASHRKRHLHLPWLGQPCAFPRPTAVLSQRSPTIARMLVKEFRRHDVFWTPSFPFPRYRDVVCGAHDVAS
jgi:hypothetical protein